MPQWCSCVMKGHGGGGGVIVSACPRLASANAVVANANAMVLQARPHKLTPSFALKRVSPQTTADTMYPVPLVRNLTFQTPPIRLAVSVQRCVHRMFQQQPISGRTIHKRRHGPRYLDRVPFTYYRSASAQKRGVILCGRFTQRGIAMRCDVLVFGGSQRITELEGGNKLEESALVGHGQDRDERDRFPATLSSRSN
ncbi:hypothetical protein BC830DRAFT_83070 [Chytriomyces sp. MP71]|nr:hypothetical protein BC830DRAFT_83070 [Chytriomyces sp. MP71]